MKKRFSDMASAGTLLLPVAFTAAAVRLSSVILFVVSVSLLLLLLARIPLFHRHESLWMFLAVVPLTVPVNLMLLSHPYLDLLTERQGFVSVLWMIVLYSILLSAEEIVFGVAARLLWPRQIPSYPKEKEE